MSAENEIWDELNIIVDAKKQRNLIKMSKDRLGKTGWDELRDVTLVILKQGLVVVDAMHAADSSVAEHRYAEWLQKHVPNILAALNHNLDGIK